MTKVLIVVMYYLVINLCAFTYMYIDKKKAIKDKYRIPEKTLFTLALLGGFVGSHLGMETFRHKTKHMKFYVVNALSLVLHCGIIYFVFFYFNWL